MKTVFCQKLKQSLPGFERAPYPGTIGQQIVEHISQQAWKEWMTHQTMLINENRLNVLEPTSRKFLEHEMQKFLFEGGAEKPAGFKAVDL
jgi:Fe-S cluster biosynthesis and repair protein YggX